ncbi:MAG: preprotein translocase subunit SecA [Patescibacteria group bacterium]
MGIFGDPNKKVIKKMQPLIGQINGFEGELQKLSDFDLQNRAKALKSRIQSTIGSPTSDSKVNLDEFLPEAFALVREAARRTLGQRHFDAQLLGGIVLHRGEISEMRTGEGKTLTATLAVYLNALSGEGVHVVTVNDYLARRDMVWMGQVYHFLGLSVGCINHMQSFLYDPIWKAPTEEKQEEADKERDELASFRVKEDFLRPCSRKEAYAADITYGTNNEYGFDYLRDNMARNADEMVQRGWNYAIVDEIDSILIDEARTPLIISAPAEESGELYGRFAKIVKTLKENEDYNLDLKMRAATLTDHGVERVEKALNIPNIYGEGGIKMVRHLEQALRAETLFHRDKDYVVRENEVIIVDEFTGRLMHGRRYSEGLHQAIEAKEGVKVQRESQTLASVTFQNFFRMYKKLAGMTGTAMTEAEEFSKIYKLEVVSVPTNKPMVRADHSDRIYKNRKGKFQAVIEEVKFLQEKGQPVLVGTVSVEQNEELSKMMEKAGIRHNLLNAKNHEREAETIAQAGKKGAVTVATNMAGRGVDIILGGAPYNEQAAEEVRALGGLAVIGTERHESRRIDNQLRGRSGRQGDPGFSRFYVSLEDELMRIFAAERIQYIMEKLGLPEDMPIENGMVSRAIESAQHRVESHNFDIRKHLLEYDDVINRHREAIYSKRRGVFYAENLKDEMLKLIENEIEQVVIFHTSDQNIKNWDIKEIWQVMNTIFPLAPETQKDLEKMAEVEAGKFNHIKVRDQISSYIAEKMKQEYAKMEERMTLPRLREIERALTLHVIDSMWVDHLEEIDYLRTGIGLRGIAGLDPLVEFKKEAYRLWNELQAGIDKQIVYSIFKIELAQRMAPSLIEREGVRTSAPNKGGEDGGRQAPGKAEDKVGRNDLCPCGSGLKFKKCHGK